jgi:hypothetical protein
VHSPTALLEILPAERNGDPALGLAIRSTGPAQALAGAAGEPKGGDGARSVAVTTLRFWGTRRGFLGPLTKCGAVLPKNRSPLNGLLMD